MNHIFFQHKETYQRLHMSSPKQVKEKLLHETDGNLWNSYSQYAVNAASLWKFKKQLVKFKITESYAGIPLENQPLPDFSSFFIHQ